MPRLEDYNVLADDGGSLGGGCTPLKGTSVRFVNDNGHHVFDIRVSDQGDLQIRGVDDYRIAIYPQVTNVVRIASVPREGLQQAKRPDKTTAGPK